MEWVEVRGKSADIAIEAAMRELGAGNRDEVDIEVIQEPEKGFLGFGGQDAVVKVKLKPRDGGRNRTRRRRRGRKGDDNSPSESKDSSDGGRQQSGRSRSGGRNGSNGPDRGSRDGSKRPESGQSRGGGGRRDSGGSSKREEKPDVDISEQAPVVEQFLSGLVSSFGLEGQVSVEVEDDVIVADVSGPQTEAMVGVRGSTIEAIHELTKTVLQRQTQSSARVRLDIAGYADRRRQALAIYANQLIDQVIEDGGELTLEPMSAGDRKVIHDAANERAGVRSYSEGESPQRYVVLAVDDSSEQTDPEEE